MAFCFTLNNPTNDEWGHLLDGIKHQFVNYMVFQLEAGSSLHVQGYFQVQRRMKITTAKRLISRRCHIEIAKGSDQHNYDYCTKVDSRVDGPHEFGLREPRSGTNGVPNVLVSFQQELKKGKTIRDVVMTDNSTLPTYCRYRNGLREFEAWCQADLDRPILKELDNVWISGPPGVGKSHSARMHNPGYFLKPPSKWWDGYNYQETVIIDDMTPSLMRSIYKDFLIWTEKVPFPAEVKGGIIHNVRPKKFVVTSNYTIEQLFERLAKSSGLDDDTISVVAIKRRFHTETYLGDFCDCELCVV